jgi:hypothetical protein
VSTPHLPTFTIINPHHASDRLGLWPRRHPVEQHLFERPHVIRQSGCHRRCTRLPHLRRATGVGGFGNWQRLASGGVWETEVVVDMVERQLLAQAVLALAQRTHTPAHRRDMLADVQVEALHE